MDYGDVLDQKRREENSYRNGDPFVMSGKGGGGGGGGRGGPGNLEDSFNLGNGLSELSGAVRKGEGDKL